MAGDRGVAMLVGAGDAIGAAVARRFAKGGFTVCIARRDAAKSQGLVDELTAADVKRLERADPRHPAWEDRSGAYLLRMERRDEQGRPLRLEVLVSRQTSMPLRYSLVRDGQMVARVTFSRFKPNVGKKLGRFRF